MPAKDTWSLPGRFFCQTCVWFTGFILIIAFIVMIIILIIH